MALEVHMARVGVGDCILIRMGNSDRKLNLLIDSGKSDNGYGETLKYIESNQEIDYGVITHDHDDHILGLFNEYFEKENSEIKENSTYSAFVKKHFIMNYWKKGAKDLFDYKKIAQIAEALLKENVDLMLTKFTVADPETTSVSEKPKGLNLIRISWRTDDKNNFQTKMERIEIGTENEEGWEHAELLILSPTKKSLKKYIEAKQEEYRKYIEDMKNKGKVVTFSKTIRKKEISTNEWDYSIQHLFDSPLSVREDTSPVNNVSISFLLFYEGTVGLFGGDAKAKDMVETAARYLHECNSKESSIPVNYMKMPHHASSHNNTEAFLNMFPTTNYLISTSGDAQYRHPGKQTLANIAKVHASESEVKLYCNYSVWKTGPLEFRRKETSWNVKDDVCKVQINEKETIKLLFTELGKNPIQISSNISISL